MSSSDREHVILVVGGCVLDRLLTVPTYPQADSKVQTIAYHEIGGGNAANTATVMAVLSGASIFRKSKFRVKLCSKVGADYIGKQVIDELQTDGVDLSCPLFRIGDKGTTTGCTTVIVSQAEKTRTCIHTPGTCGYLTLDELAQVDLDEVFQNVVHLHSDARHTNVALALAKEATRRGITVSLDAEKDRNSKALDGLLEVATTVFTNSQQVEAYLSRLTREWEDSQGRVRLRDATVVARGNNVSDADVALLAHVIRPSAFFSRWYQQNGKEVVITRGDQGAVYIQCQSTESKEDSGGTPSTNQIEITVDGEQLNSVRLRHVFRDHSVNATSKLCSSDYILYSVGILSGVNVVDTTGAGDAFIGSFILGRLFPSLKDDIQTCLAFSSWVSGRKLSGPGARSAIPKAAEVDEVLGIDPNSLKRALDKLVGQFCSNASRRNKVMPNSGSWENFVRKMPGSS